MLAPALKIGLALAAAAAGVSVIAAGRYPSGKGVFIRSVRHCGSPAECVAVCKAMGLKWVSILLAWQYIDRPSTVYLNKDMVRYARAFRKAGIRVWLWAWPVPTKAGEIAGLYQSARAGGIKPHGLILDPEGPYYGKRHDDHARRDLEVWQALNVPLGITSYGGGPPNHPSFAWHVWSRTDFGIPQIYDSKHALGAAYPGRAMNSWRAAGWKRLIPAWGASNKHAPDDMRWHIRNTPPEYKAAMWWDLYWLMRSRGRREVVAEMRIPKMRRVAKVA